MFGVVTTSDRGYKPRLDQDVNVERSLRCRSGLEIPSMYRRAVLELFSTSVPFWRPNYLKL